MRTDAEMEQRIESYETLIDNTTDLIRKVVHRERINELLWVMGLE